VVAVGDDGENANADDVLAASLLRIEYRRVVIVDDEDDAAAIISANALAGIDQPKLRRRWWLEEEMMPTELMVCVLNTIVNVLLLVTLSVQYPTDVGD